MSEALPAETAAVTEASLRKQLAAEIEITAETNAAVPEDPRAMAQRLRAEAAEILDLCRLAGHPALAAEFVRQGRTPAVVRKALLAGRAEQFEAAPTMPIDPTAAVGENPLIAAIKAAYPKER
jgi:protein-disulfide isomerase-like protein with CxxC motif